MLQTTPQKVPARVDIKIGFQCNNHCRFCVQGDKRLRYQPPLREQLKQFLEENRGTYEGVVFTGGEPTLRKDIFHLVKLARELGYRSIQLQSNGRMFSYLKFCREAISAGVTEFSPALHGHSAELHDYLTRSEGAFKQVCHGILNLKQLGQRVVTNSVITRTNYRHLPALASLLVRLGVDQFQLAFVHPVGSAGPEELFFSIVPRFELIEQFVKRALDVGIQAQRTVMTEAIPLCFMVDYDAYVGERIMPQTRIFDAEGVIDDYSKYRNLEGKAHGEPCTKCGVREKCEGVWKEYAALFGYGEFRPIQR